ncbi:MAG: membrane protease subunit, stomatin/prohibitin [Candidatus Edwardsbacteria bacterium RIFOXYD12_FULL_50_11]|uniref:Membrane protease subunit, stomatin/prohibitin n=1 Tax=Candidatus Edwardsbacteria bacterium GWF2_54_11 TaxID=1817851 RepID=A0A1F5R8E2_9BACT|nr:MAG: membrane protease subunit, stomatin/prohibitin [Candidatus Edwardsbacteria bacterium RifOxyC12_full_54_24]OGF08284.1 MAG: membrane protease subunit, stomatin/prohibitin [Candidatus Edwardsbacteria bacterium RifOxyA12_full_54_48]OGF10333.1 MAG: membrane protease subunit, stomatin/prohibitin [Candidatus Edwardsbacteria bacterium GWF2_54_11]OGF11581.1 MAG: membrane protease subunit, stomatin/prohibitin [Candidatus Edwardsbacteria bacterium GWE2_54_12]OGF17765.1 MAG: membrane protease subun
MFFIFTLIVAFVAGYMWFSAGKKTQQFNEAFAKNKAVSGIVAVFFLIVAVFQMLTVIPAGYVGIVDFFGNVSAKTLKSGINLRNPLARIVKFSIKTQEMSEDMHVPSKEGLTVQLDATVLFHLDPDKAAEVYKTVGPDYVNIILVPQFRSVCRGVTALYEAKALYTSQREELARLIQVDLEKMVAARGIVIETTPLRRVTLPNKVTDAVEEKLKAEQESQRMEFILTKEKQEAERKRIEAQGISDFQNIVAKGISEPLLRWKGIEATEKLAQSPNAKVIVIGAGKDGLPIILDTK